MDWAAWHQGYEDPASPLAERLGVVQALIREFLDSHTDLPLRVVSLCAGDGRDLIEVLAANEARGHVAARLVELDPDLAAEARQAASRAGLANVEVVVADAALTDAYLGAVPAHLVLACGVFGNISNDDVKATVGALPSFCRRGGAVIWTRHRREADLTPKIRQWFSEAGFVERSFSSPGVGSYAVGVHELRGPARTLAPDCRLFTFLR